MRIALDAQLAVGTATGIGTYQRDLAAALRDDGAAVELLDAPWLDPWRFDRRVLWEQVLLPARLARSTATVFHATAGTLPVVRRVRTGPVPTVVTIHDQAWLRVQRHAPWYARAYFGGLMQALYRDVDAAICPSRFARDETVAALPHLDPAVVHNGVAPVWGALARRPERAPYALAVGTVEVRKNLLVAVEALAHVPELRLVAAGPATPYLETVRARAAALGVAERFEARGYVDAAELAALYAGAAVAVVPSRYEGFGYALAEALCAGVPVLAAATSSLVEVADGDAPLLPPDDPAAWAAALAAVLADRGVADARAAAVRARAVARFAWSRVARETRAVYQRALVDR